MKNETEDPEGTEATDEVELQLSEALEALIEGWARERFGDDCPPDSAVAASATIAEGVSH